ncbi:MAG: PAS domain S-box protein [Bacteroidetes bacterium]|nr:PAS domain S-box protein [Bacteroidota bacterium]
MDELVKDLRILIVDDDEDDFFITSEYIRKIPGYNFSIDACYTYRDALEMIGKDKYDLYFIDYILGGKTGLDLIKEVAEVTSEAPFILLTGKGNKAVDIEALQAGAVDYLVKAEINTEKLERCIRYSIERLGSMKAIRANERKFRNIFERSVDAVFIADEKLTFSDINAGATRLLGYSIDELLSMNLFQMLPSEEEREELTKMLGEQRSVDDRELVLNTKNDGLKYCIVSLSREEEPGKIYYQGIIHDITNLKKAERATLRMEKRGVADRLVHVLAHEVRNPLNNINLSLEQLSPELAETDAAIYADIISRNSKRIETLINELLSSSRPAQIQKAPTILQDVINESIRTANDRLTLKHISLTQQLPEEPLQIIGDAEKLKIALLNIIINAIEAMEEGKGELFIELKEEEGKIRLTISDNGCGISDENMARLFEPYFTAKRNGMGIGLASTLNILQSHKAEIEVQSKLNEGTSFIIYFRK